MHAIKLKNPSESLYDRTWQINGLMVTPAAFFTAILDRGISELSANSWETVKNGFVDGGWQDTSLLRPGMKVKIALRFEDFTGIYVYHCHNLEHEDMGMMRNYKVVE